MVWKQRRVTCGWLAAASVLTLVACGGNSATSTSNGSSAPGGSATASGVETNPGGDIPDSQAFVTFTDPAGQFTVTVPEGWAQTTTGTTTLFSDKYNSIALNTVAAVVAPTVESARSVELPKIQTTATGFSAGKVASASRHAGTAVVLTYQAHSAPNAVTGKVAVEAVERYEFWRAGHEVVLTLSAPVGSDNVDPWRKVTDSFAWRG
jgi:hypothetical protein